MLAISVQNDAILNVYKTDNDRVKQATTARTSKSTSNVFSNIGRCKQWDSYSKILRNKRTMYISLKKAMSYLIPPEEDNVYKI